MKKLPRDTRIQATLNAAIEEFLEKGYDGATLESIATRAGLTKGGIYHHFSGKDTILLAANRQFLKPMSESMNRAAEAPGALTGLRQYMQFQLEFWAAHRREAGLYCLALSKMLQDSELRTGLGRYYQQVREFYEAALRRAVRQQELPGHDCVARALLIMTMMDGMIAYLAATGASASEAFRMIADVALMGVDA